MYAVWFPASGVLKTGFTEHAQNYFLSTARNRARRHGWEAADGCCIWKRPGDTRTEAWMQATLSFRWWPALSQAQNRICEWLKVPGLPEGEIVGILDEVYRLVPADVRGDGLIGGEALL